MTIDNEAAFIDITKVICPVTFVKVLAALEEIEDGQLLRIRINNSGAMNHVSSSLKAESHRITFVQQNEDGTFDMIVKKGGLSNQT